MNDTAALATRTIIDAVIEAKPKFLGRLPGNINVDHFMLGVQTAIQKNPKLIDCEAKSLLLAAYEAAEVGCDLAPSKQLGWLIPYGREVQFQPSYRFFIQVAHKTGLIKTFYAEVVYENDQFTRQFAPKRNLFHAPPQTGERGQAIGAYAFVEFVDGNCDWEYLSKAQIEIHRKHSKQPSSLMWTTFWEEGWRKTPMRVIFKRLPQENEGMERLAEIVAKDAAADLEPIVPGALEVEAGAPVVAAAPLTYRVGENTTQIFGNCVRIAKGLGKMNGRPEKDGSWTIGASFTQDFLDLCAEAGITATEVAVPRAEIPPAEPIEPEAESTEVVTLNQMRELETLYKDAKLTPKAFAKLLSERFGFAGPLKDFPAAHYNDLVLALQKQGSLL